MEYVYAALLLNASGQDVDENGITDILEAADVEVDEARVKALVSALDGVDIENAIQSAAVSAQAAPAGGAAGGAETESGEPEEADEEEAEAEEEEEDDVSEEEAAEGLGELFG
jgi:large subunit ribosomal protein L12